MALAAGDFDRKKHCAPTTDFGQCNLIVEKAVAAVLPGVINRKPRQLQIHARNGKILVKKTLIPVKGTREYGFATTSRNTALLNCAIEAGKLPLKQNM